jgi:hypothetical protein
MHFSESRLGNGTIMHTLGIRRLRAPQLTDRYAFKVEERMGTEISESMCM